MLFRQMFNGITDIYITDYDDQMKTALKDLCSQNRMSLTKCRRSDDEMLNYCKNAYLLTLQF